MVALNFIWNSNEVLASFDLPIVGTFQLRYYSLMFIIAFSLGWYLTKKIYLNEGKTVQQLDTLFVYTAVATLVGARLGDCFFYNWDYFKDHLLEIFLPIKEKAGGGWQLTGFSGLASHGAAVGIIIRAQIQRHQTLVDIRPCSNSYHYRRNVRALWQLL